MWILYIIIGLVILVLLYLGTTYNSLVVLRNRVKNQWAQVDVQLKKRSDMVPNLVETVKGYATHEKETFEAVIQARNNFNAATTTEAEIETSGELSKVLSKLMMLSEAYPELKSDKNFMQMQLDLKDIEEKIAFARQFYNDRVLAYMEKIQKFPSNVVAGMFGFKEMKYFEVSESDRVAPKVSF